MKALAEVFADLKKLLTEFKNMDPNTKSFSLIGGMFIVCYLLTSKSMMKKETNQAKCHIHISGKSDTSTRRASDRSFGRCSRRRHDYHSMHATVPEGRPVGQEVDMGDSGIDDSDPG